MCRETYLERALEHMRPWFEAEGYTLPDNIRVSCGWPSAGQRAKAIGECWGTSQSDGAVFEIFISPRISDSSRALDILLHEAVHATVGLENGHNKVFKRCAESLGLTGKMTATTASDALKERLNALITDTLGEYPHYTLNATTAKKKQGTRLVKLECGGCGMVLRTTRKWISEIGMPTCACTGLFFEA